MDGLAIILSPENCKLDMVFGDDDLGVAYVLQLHAANIFPDLGSRSNQDHYFSAGVKNMGMRSMAAFVSRVDPDFEPTESPLRHALV